jgi:hypothetical protein
MPITPDTKNWTWVLEDVCPECGFDATAVDLSSMGELVRANVAQWPPLLASETATVRPTDEQWSALEYGCHVRDVFALFDERLRLMLAEDGPKFANWDQDVTAVEERYDRQDPAVVAVELVAAGNACADRWETVGDGDWQRTGDRSDGSSFTVETFARYFLHDPVHHLADVRAGYELIARPPHG